MVHVPDFVQACSLKVLGFETVSTYFERYRYRVGLMEICECLGLISVCLGLGH